MSAILNHVIEKRNGYYVHALEVSDKYELESAVEHLTEEFINAGFTTTEVKEFFNTISLYCLEDSNEDEVYNFDIDAYIDELI